MLIRGSDLAGPTAPLEDLTVGRPEVDGDEVAISSALSSVTWRELHEVSTRLAWRYRAHGLEAGDRLASLVPNRVELIVHYLACCKAGIVAVPLNYRYTPVEIDHALRVSGARSIVAHAERGGDLAASREAGALPLDRISLEGELPGGSTSLEELIGDRSGEWGELGPVDPSTPAAIFFTSGSTGPAKGVTHTHETLRWMLASAVAAFGLNHRDAFLPASSMSHIGGFMWALSSLSVGARVVVARTFDAHELLPLLREQRPTLMAILPAALAALIRDHDVRHQDFACLRMCRAGADKVSREILEEFAEVAGFPIDEGYGMTEVGLATLNPPGRIKEGSIGRPVAGFGIDIRGEGGGTVEPGTVGRVFIRSHSRMSGYWEAPDATAEVFRGDWLDSGDLARADEDGYLWFFGRKKQVIVHDGSNISPLEVEAALMEHPSVALAGVVGISDPVHGEDVRAYVTLRPEAARPTSDELIRASRSRVGYKAPEEVVFLDEMPTNPTGKIDRVALKRWAEDHLHPRGLPS